MYTGNDFQLDPSTVCVLAVVNNSPSDCGSCFRIDITQDSDSESTEQFNISFTVISVQPEGVNINNFSEAVIYIQDDDGKSHYWATLCEKNWRASMSSRAGMALTLTIHLDCSKRWKQSVITYFYHNYISIATTCMQ